MISETLLLHRIGRVPALFLESFYTMERAHGLARMTVRMHACSLSIVFTVLLRHTESQILASSHFHYSAAIGQSMDLR